MGRVEIPTENQDSGRHWHAGHVMYTALGALGALGALISKRRGSKVSWGVWRCPHAMFDTIYLRERHPIGENIRSDGDAVRPIEEMTDGEHSRKMCNRDLSYYCNSFAVVCVSTPNVKGSELKNMVRERYCYCIGRNGNIPIWYCPANKQTYKTKD